MNRDAMIRNATIRRRERREIRRACKLLKITLCVYKTLAMVHYVADDYTGNTRTPDVDTMHWVYHRLNRQWATKVRKYGILSAPNAMRQFLLRMKKVVERPRHDEINNLIGSLLINRISVTEALISTLPMIPAGNARLVCFIRRAIEVDVINDHNEIAANAACTVFRMQRQDWVNHVVQCME